MYALKLGPYNAIALGIASELAEFFYFLLLGAHADRVLASSGFSFAPSDQLFLHI